MRHRPIVVALAALSRSARPGQPPLDRAILAVVPYRVSAADTSLRYLREGVVDLLTSRLAGTEAIRLVDSRVLLPASRGAGGDLTPTQVQALAERLGA